MAQSRLEVLVSFELFVFEKISMFSSVSRFELFASVASSAASVCSSFWKRDCVRRNGCIAVWNSGFVFSFLSFVNFSHFVVVVWTCVTRGTRCGSFVGRKSLHMFVIDGI